jgi:DNA recombination protein RmuC
VDSVAISPVVVGVAIGLAISAVMWMVLQGKRVSELRAMLSHREAKLAGVHADLAAARQDCSRVTAELDATRQVSAEKLALLQTAETKLRDAFAALSSEALKNNNEAFLQLARTSLTQFQQTAASDLDGRRQAFETLVQPLRESLEKVDAKLNEVERGRASTQAQLSEQIRSLTNAQQLLHTETNRLSRALRSPNVRGQWGELQLRRVLENAGMVAGSHYEIKESVVGEDGRLTPDVVVKLPGGRNVVVDAKVPLTAYLDASECEDDMSRDMKLREHARQVKDHVTRLAGKSYWAHFQPTPH